MIVLRSLTVTYSVLSRKGFVHAESVMSLRKQLGCHTFRTEEKGSHFFLL